MFEQKWFEPKWPETLPHTNLRRWSVFQAPIEADFAVLPVPSRVGVRWRTLAKVEWGTLPRPPSGQADTIGLREDIHDRPRARRLQLINSQFVRTGGANEFPTRCTGAV